MENESIKGSALEIFTTADRSDLEYESRTVFRERWPEFIFHDPIPHRYMGRVKEYFSQFSILLTDNGQLVAGGWGVPIFWDGELSGLPTGYDGALRQSVIEHEDGQVQTALSFMAAAVAPSYDRRGLAAEVLRVLTERADSTGLCYVIAPLRPTLKHQWPKVAMAEYATWTRADGFSVDPWIRTHQRLGAEILVPASSSMVIEGTVTEWESWTELKFPTTGDYVIPGALNLVSINLEQNQGRYVEENLWVRHR